VITCNTLIISIGLSVDFVAPLQPGRQVGQIPLSVTDKSDFQIRVQEPTKVTRIGPAVLNGGFSTLLAMSLLSSSQSYAFLSFKIFLLTCLFGPFHRLLALPVILSLVGPPPHAGQVTHMLDGWMVDG
jgi:hypothetical protein